jgi:WD40 repeat protein
MPDAGTEQRDTPLKAEADKLRVFISYSRADTTFADELVAGLEYDRGFEVSIDRKAIHEGEDWKARLGALIAGADTVVFILSPKSAASPICQWEVEEAERLSKRILPVQAVPLNGARPPPQLAALNYVRFDPEDDGRPRSFMAGLAGLRRALSTDIAWLREHTRLLTRAREWEAAGRAENRLLSGSDIAEAKDWLDRWPKDAPAPTELHRDFVAASEHADVARASKERQQVEQLRAALEAAERREREVSRQTQRLLAIEVRRAREAHRLSSAMRLALVGEPSEEERRRGIAPEPTRRAELAATAHAALDLACLTGHSGAVMSAAFSPDGARVVTASHDTTARVWDAASRTELCRLTHDGAVMSAAFSPDGGRVVTASQDNTARLWDAASGAELQRLAHEDGVVSATFSPDGARVVTADKSTVRVWVAAGGAELYRLPYHGWIESAAFSPDGARVVTASTAFTAHVWDAASGAELFRLAHDRGVVSAAFSPDGARIVTGSDDNTARLWDAASGTELCRLAHNGRVDSAAFSPDGGRLVTASKDKTVRVWDAASGAELCRLTKSSRTRSAAFSPDGARVVTVSYDNMARLWDAASGVELCCLAHDGWVHSAAFSPDGARVVTASDDRTARLWDAAIGAELCRLAHDSRVVSAVFSPDGGRVLTSYAIARTAWLWDAASGTELCRLAHDAHVHSASFSPDGDRVVTAAADNKARLWDAAIGAEHCRFAHDGQVQSAAFSPDGGRVVTASHDNTARLWDVTWLALTEDAIVRAVARTRLNGEGRLTDDEMRLLRPLLGEVDPDVVSLAHSFARRRQDRGRARPVAPPPRDGSCSRLQALGGSGAAKAAATGLCEGRVGPSRDGTPMGADSSFGRRCLGGWVGLDRALPAVILAHGCAKRLL